MRQQLSIEGAFLQGELDPPFHHLAFEMPEGATRLEVTYHFEKLDAEEAKRIEEELRKSVPYGAGGQNVVDVGIFDQRGHDELTGGFRGWSGGSRTGFYISHRDATPGYIRGPLAPGEWSVVLGCPTLRGERARYWVDIDIDVDPNAGASDVQLFAPVQVKSHARNGERRWYKGDFHSHTVHSDGYNSIDEYVVEAGRVGLDFLAITDHNTTSHFEEIAMRTDDLLLVPGEEVTTAWGHANVWGLGAWVDFRCTDDAGMQRVLDFVHERGGLFSPNHPKPGYPWEFGGVQGYRVAEAWQGPWRLGNEESRDFWERRLRNGERVTAVGGSDCHSIAPARIIHPWTLGNPCTWVNVQGELDEAGVLDAVRAGHAFVSEDPTGPFLEFTAECNGATYMMGDAIEAPQGSDVLFKLGYRGPVEKKLRLIRDGEPWQEVVAEKEEQTFEFEARLDEPGYVRTEAAGFRGRPERGEVVHALTNPIYLRPEQS
ncbi:MAG: CehA/McbA family metallohydrolase [Chloroflexi bacterium]|nr:CehA/McbA family metallohydrolase [Chloroflexota bacterium]